MAGKKDAAWWRNYRARRKGADRDTTTESSEGAGAAQTAEPDRPPVTTTRSPRAKPPFLAAPDDDCATCGHDRHEFHLAACTFRTGVDGRGKPRYCGCSKWQEAVLF